MLINNDTICAICSPSGNSTYAAVRISGANSFEIATILSSTPLPLNSRNTVSSKIRLDFDTPNGNVSRNAPCIFYIMPAPKSYTTEDVIEIILPGATPILNATIKAICSHGARVAQAGEFTMRAFLHGRIDLGQAEAVERIILAETSSEHQEAIGRMHGGIATKINKWRDELVLIAGTVEATLDFEEEDIGEDIESDLSARLNSLATSCREVAASASHYRPDIDGIPVVLAGLTNAGKSSLLNALLGYNAVIVSHEKSTTRDRIVHDVQIGRFVFNIEDCPGIDTSEDIIAVTASDIARKRFSRAGFIMLVVDASKEIDDELQNLIDHIPPCRILLILNKIDLEINITQEKLQQIISTRPGVTIASTLEISAQEAINIDKLKVALEKEGLADLSVSGGQLSSREARELEEAAKRCEEAALALEYGQEIAAFELRGAYEAFARVCGEGYAEDILENVFSRFCIGK